MVCYNGLLFGYLQGRYFMFFKEINFLEDGFNFYLKSYDIK